MSERQTRYPISRKDVLALFKKPVSDQPNPKMYDVTRSVKPIRDQLDKMQKYGYQLTFNYSPRMSEGRKSMCRKVSAKFHCEYCNNTFTSLLATYQVIFTFSNPPWKFKVNDPDRKRFPQSGRGQKVNFNLRLYDMDCLKCKSPCQGLVYESQMNAVAITFCILIAEIVDNVPKRDHYDDRYKQNEDVHFHRSDLCQACKEGVCFNRPKDQTLIKESSKFSDKESSSLHSDSGQEDFYMMKRPKGMKFSSIYQSKCFDSDEYDSDQYNSQNQKFVFVKDNEGRCQGCNYFGVLDFPCGCQKVKYCSEACMEKDKKYHPRTCDFAKEKQLNQSKNPYINLSFQPNELNTAAKNDKNIISLKNIFNAFFLTVCLSALVQIKKFKKIYGLKTI